MGILKTKKSEVQVYHELVKNLKMAPLRKNTTTGTIGNIP